MLLSSIENKKEFLSKLALDLTVAQYRYLKLQLKLVIKKRANMQLTSLLKQKKRKEGFDSHVRLFREHSFVAQLWFQFMNNNKCWHFYRRLGLKTSQITIETDVSVGAEWHRTALTLSFCASQGNKLLKVWLSLVPVLANTSNSLYRDGRDLSRVFKAKCRWNKLNWSMSKEFGEFSLRFASFSIWQCNEYGLI